MDNWISVSEKLPELYEPGISIIVNVTDSEGVTCGYYDFERKEWIGYGFHNEKGEKITHWMHLPTPPQS